MVNLVYLRWYSVFSSPSLLIYRFTHMIFAFYLFCKCICISTSYIHAISLPCTHLRHWRFHSMALSFLRDLVHLDENYPAEVVSTFLNNLIHDQLDLRKVRFSFSACPFLITPKIVVKTL